MDQNGFPNSCNMLKIYFWRWSQIIGHYCGLFLDIFWSPFGLNMGYCYRIAFIFCSVCFSVASHWLRSRSTDFWLSAMSCFTESTRPRSAATWLLHVLSSWSASLSCPRLEFASTVRNYYIIVYTNYWYWKGVKLLWG